jgi:putative DNA primase/helicase
MSTVSTAMEYAKRGWFVVPDHGVVNGGCTCVEGINCKSPGKHPRMERDTPEGHFRGEGTTNAEQIKEWWTRWPNSNLAIVCGAKSNLVVVDVDPRNGGLETLEILCGTYGPMALTTLTCQSGGGGLHLYFRHPQRGEKVRNRIGLLPGIDIKADGGRIVAPPSKHRSGGVYEWLNPTAQLRPLPDTLLRKIQIMKGTGTWQAMRKAQDRC